MHLTQTVTFRSAQDLIEPTPNQIAIMIDEPDKTGTPWQHEGRATPCGKCSLDIFETRRHLTLSFVQGIRILKKSYVVHFPRETRFLFLTNDLLWPSRNIEAARGNVDCHPDVRQFRNRRNGLQQNIDGTPHHVRNNLPRRLPR